MPTIRPAADEARALCPSVLGRRRDETHFALIARARAPLSPPTIIQSMPVRSTFPRSSLVLVLHKPPKASRRSPKQLPKVLPNQADGVAGATGFEPVAFGFGD